MKKILPLGLVGLAFLGLQGCAAMEGYKNSNSTQVTQTVQGQTVQGSTVPSSDYLNRESVASPAAKISGGSGASHSGMSSSPR